MYNTPWPLLVCHCSSLGGNPYFPGTLAPFSLISHHMRVYLSIIQDLGIFGNSSISSNFSAFVADEQNSNTSCYFQFISGIVEMPKGCWITELLEIPKIPRSRYVWCVLVSGSHESWSRIQSWFLDRMCVNFIVDRISASPGYMCFELVNIQGRLHVNVTLHKFPYMARSTPESVGSSLNSLLSPAHPSRKGYQKYGQLTAVVPN